MIHPPTPPHSPSSSTTTTTWYDVVTHMTPRDALYDVLTHMTPRDALYDVMTHMTPRDALYDVMTLSPGRYDTNRPRMEPVRGMELLWQPAVVEVYLLLLNDASNPETLEAAAGAIQNLAACDWQVRAKYLIGYYLP